MDRDIPASPDPTIKPKHPPPAVNEVRAAARLLLALGCQPVRVLVGTKRPCDDNWQTIRFADADIDGHFTEGYQLGVMTGEPSGWRVDVDLDCQEAVDLAEKYLPPTGCITGRPSRPRSHWWYVAVGAKNKQFRDPVNGEMIVELRSTGLQTLVGPSVHPDDQEPYDMLKSEPAVVDAADLAARVAALHEAVVLAKYGKLPASFQRGSFLAEPTVTPADRRVTPSDDTKTLHRARRYLARMPAAISGQNGHGKAYAAAVCMVHGFGLDPQVAFDLLKHEYNARCEPPWSDKELWHKVNDAVTKPHMRPYGWLRDQRGPEPVALANRQRGTDPRSAIAAAADRESATPSVQDGVTVAADDHVPWQRTDYANAERFAMQHADAVRFCHSTGVWLVWDGARWKADDAGTPHRLAAETARAMYRAAGDQSTPEARSDAARWAIKCEFKARLDAMVSLAKSQPSLVVRVEDLDSDPWLLNVANGTIDLRTGELRPHRRGDLMTKVAQVSYDPNAGCPRFLRFIGEIFPQGADLIGFVQRLLGMCLTGDVSDQHLHILHGGGANGKSVLCGAVRYVMGEYAADAPPSLLAGSGRDEHPTEIADLMGRRLVIASETEEGASFKLQLVKRLTGETTLKARFMRQDYFTFRRTHKTILMTNNLPRVREDSEAVWRRLLLVPFEVTIPECRRDPGLLDALIAEAPGILAWIVRGCLEWQNVGLSPPECVRRATESYRGDEDTLGLFLEECCSVDKDTPNATGAPSRFTPWRDLWSRYIDWCKARGNPALTAKRLGTELDRRGYTTTTKRVGQAAAKVRLGISLAVPAWPEPEPASQ